MLSVLWDPRGRAVLGPALVDSVPGREQAFVLLAQAEMGPYAIAKWT